MTCRQCQRRLSPHLDDALAADERRNVLNHLAQCPACAHRLLQLERNRQLLRALPAAEVTGPMELRLELRLQSAKSAPRTPHSTVGMWWRRWGAVSVGTLATGAASFLFYLSTLQAPPEVSAEEVVASMEQLLDALDPDDGVRILNEETAAEAVPDWREELNQWFWDNESDKD